MRGPRDVPHPLHGEGPIRRHANLRAIPPVVQVRQHAHPQQRQHGDEIVKGVPALAPHHAHKHEGQRPAEDQAAPQKHAPLLDDATDGGGRGFARHHGPPQGRIPHDPRKAERRHHAGGKIAHATRRANREKSRRNRISPAPGKSKSGANHERGKRHPGPCGEHVRRKSVQLANGGKEESPRHQHQASPFPGEAPRPIGQKRSHRQHAANLAPPHEPHVSAPLSQRADIHMDEDGRQHADEDSRGQALQQGEGRLDPRGTPTPVKFTWQRTGGRERQRHTFHPTRQTRAHAVMALSERILHPSRAAEHHGERTRVVVSMRAQTLLQPSHGGHAVLTAALLGRIDTADRAFDPQSANGLRRRVVDARSVKPTTVPEHAQQRAEQVPLRDGGLEDDPHGDNGVRVARRRRDLRAAAQQRVRAIGADVKEDRVARQRRVRNRRVRVVGHRREVPRLQRIDVRRPPEMRKTAHRRASPAHS